MCGCLARAQLCSVAPLLSGRAAETRTPLLLLLPNDVTCCSSLALCLQALSLWPNSSLELTICITHDIRRVKLDRAKWPPIWRPFKGNKAHLRPLVAVRSTALLAHCSSGATGTRRPLSDGQLDQSAAFWYRWRREERGGGTANRLGLAEGCTCGAVVALLLVAGGWWLTRRKGDRERERESASLTRSTLAFRLADWRPPRVSSARELLASGARATGLRARSHSPFGCARTLIHASQRNKLTPVKRLGWAKRARASEREARRGTGWQDILTAPPLLAQRHTERASDRQRGVTLNEGRRWQRQCAASPVGQLLGRAGPGRTIRVKFECPLVA